MATYLKRSVAVFYLSLLSLINAFGQAGLDDSQMRERTATRIMQNHGIEIDWRNTSLLEITDIEARINSSARIKRDHGISFDWHKTSLLELTDAEARLATVKRIKRDHGVPFDWEKVSLQELTDSEARMNAAKQISIATKKSIDWKEHSLEDLLRMGSGLTGVDPNSSETILSFDVLFPLANQRAMGLHKLNQEEKKQLQKHVEALLITTAQARAQQAFTKANISQKLRLTAPSNIYVGTGSRHWIKKNVDSGSMIILEDGSI
jgi:hypothetical protein